MKGKSPDCNVAVVGAGPYGLALSAYLRAAGVETRTFGEPMAFWQNQMPAGMCLRSNWGASHIADPKQELTLDAYCRQKGNHIAKPIPLERFVDYGRWYQSQAVPDLEKRNVLNIDVDARGFKVILADGEEFISKRVVVATGISAFASRPAQFAADSQELASHTSEHTDLRKFKGRRVVVIGAGQSALESAALFKEAGVEAEVIARCQTLNWVGLHPKLHHLGMISKMLYSTRDVGPAGISRLVAMPHLFRKFPRGFQDRTAYRAIRPAGAGWLKPRLDGGSYHTWSQSCLGYDSWQPASPETGRWNGAACRSRIARDGISRGCLQISIPFPILSEATECGKRLSRAKAWLGVFNPRATLRWQAGGVELRATARFCVGN